MAKHSEINDKNQSPTTNNYELSEEMKKRKKKRNKRKNCLEERLTQ